MYRVLVICVSSLKLNLMGSNRSSNYSKIMGVMSNLNPVSSLALQAAVKFGADVHDHVQ